MDAEIGDNDIRAAVVRLLEELGYEVKDTASGSGVPRMSRLLIKKESEVLTCAVKTTSGGRISFTRASDGSYRVLSDVDRVLHARRNATDPSKVLVTMFDSSVVVKAFEANYDAKAARGMEHTPLWVNPDPEDAWQVTGSGFGKEALWSHEIPVFAANVPSLIGHTPSPQDAVTGSEPALVERVRVFLAEQMRVPPEHVEIDRFEVRVKLH